MPGSHVGATAEPIGQQIECDCGEGYWKYLLSGTGLYVTQRKCFSCERMKLIVCRNDQVEGVTTLLGTDEGSVRDSLKRIDGLKAWEVEGLVHNATRIAEAG